MKLYLQKLSYSVITLPIGEFVFKKKRKYLHISIIQKGSLHIKISHCAF